VSGRRLGSQYELGERLGRGGMGEVFRGWRVADDSPVAVKVLRAEFAADRKMVARFVQERDVVCSLSHSNLVPVRDLVVEGDTLAIVMDLVEGGQTLRDTLESFGGTLPPGLAFEVAAQVLDALEVVHRAGVVHRDVKPENVLVPAGELITARLSDFGVARALGEDGTLTTHTSLIGTPSYMAPELGEGGEVTAQADLYSLGCLLYELVAGAPPFSGLPVVVLRRHSEEVPQLIPELALPAWIAIASLLEKDPMDRPASASEASVMLRRAKASLVGVEPLSVFRPQNQTMARSTPGRITPAEVITAERHPSPAATGSETQREARTGTVVVSRQRRVRRGSSSAAEGSASRRGWVFVLPVLVVVAVAAGLLVWSMGGSGASEPDPVMFASTPETLPSGLVVTRAWTLHGIDYTKLDGSVSITNSATASVTDEVEEVIPKSVAESVDQIRFTPAPDVIVDRDPIVRYKIADLAPGETKTFTYEVEVAATDDDPTSRLEVWGSERAVVVTQRQKDGDTATPVTLTTLTLTPATLALTVGETAELAVSGTMSDGTSASAAVLAGVAFTPSDTNLAAITNGTAPTITAKAAGTVAIQAQAGTLTATTTITITKPAGSDIASATTRRTGTATTGPPPVGPAATDPPNTPPPATTATTKPADTTTTSTTTAATSTTTTTTTTTTITPATVPGVPRNVVFYPWTTPNACRFEWDVPQSDGGSPLTGFAIDSGVWESDGVTPHYQFVPPTARGQSRGGPAGEFQRVRIAAQNSIGLGPFSAWVGCTT
jgi:serine/threonine protein kinase